MVVVQQRRRFLLVRQHYLIALVLLVVLLSLWPLRNARENALVKDSPEVKPRELPLQRQTSTAAVERRRVNCRRRVLLSMKQLRARVQRLSLSLLVRRRRSQSLHPTT
jgi:hypothetical protein